MKRTAIKILMIFLWTVMALLLSLTAVLVCGVKILRPQVLTPIICRVANDNLNAEVTLDKAQLVFEPAFPILKLKLDGLTVVSKAFDSEERVGLPVYADTLLTVESFQGDVDVLRFLTKGEIALGNVEFVRPGMNIVLDKNGKGNFDIYSSSADDDSPLELPAISIRRFAFEEPRAIRYFNAIDSTEATVVIVSKAELLGEAEPLYKLKIDGSIGGPYAALIGMEDVAVGLDGRLRWNPSEPTVFAIEDFSVYGAFIHALLSVELAYDNTLTVRSAKLDVEPVRFADMLTVVPQEYIKAYGLVEPMFVTDAAVGVRTQLLKPFCPTNDSIPYADVDFEIAESSLRYGKADVRRLALDLGIQLRGNDPDSIRVILRKGIIAGPATTLELDGEVASLISDPDFRFGINGTMDMDKLPPVLLKMVPGYLSGRLALELKGSGRMSMLEVNRLHELTLDGDVDASNLYFLSSDTAKMALADNICFKFSTKRQRKGNVSAPLMGADINVDSASVLIDGVKIDLADLRMGAAVENNGRMGDTTVVLPVGAGMRIRKLNILSVTDSAGAHIRNIGGRVTVQRYKNSKKLPLITAHLDVDVLSAGTSDTRVLLRDAEIHAATYKNPEKVQRRAELKHITDSISRKHPELSADSVLKLAVAKRRHAPGTHGRRRVQSVLSDEDTEVLEWDLSSGLRKFLLDWELDGYVKTDKARLFTPYFPLRNRIETLDVAFTTDSLKLNNMTYKAGKSDISITGIVSNMKRALTSKKNKSSLKLNFDVKSDFLDVNQLAAAAFAGSAYSERNTEVGEGISLNTNEDDLERHYEAMVAENSEAMGPLLIPTNVDGQLRLRAKKVLYDSIAFRGLRGDILLYDGAVNLHELCASSEAGDMSLSALYSAPKTDDMKFGFGLRLDNFKIERFLRLVPAIDSIMPLLRDFSGIINADIAATADVDTAMNLIMPSLDAAVRLSGDSIAFIDPETYSKIGKWLRFRDRADNKIKSMKVEMVVKDNMLQLFPFSFEIDRYRLGVLGHNDMALNFDYHVSVLKSPLPFSFGVNIKGNPDSYKVRFGGAKFKDGMAYESLAVVDSARVNLVRQIENVFRRGVSNSRFAKLNISAPLSPGVLEGEEPLLTPADSLALINEGILPAPVQPVVEEPKTTKGRKKKSKKSTTVEKDAIRPKE